MKLMALIIGLCFKGNIRSSFFSEAFSESIKEVFAEMGYRAKDCITKPD
jgi:hypothetical protein